MLHTGPLITLFYLVFFFFVGPSALLLATTHVGLITLRQLRNCEVICPVIIPSGAPLYRYVYIEWMCQLVR